MSYVQANTGNPLGRRGLGRLGRMGWDNAPYPVYQLPQSVARLNGEFNPAGPDPSTSASGAITYRIDPRTGRYNFYRTDIKPRGVFMQNTFQHPAPSVMSALGVPVLPIGKSVTASTIQRGRTARDPYIAMRPGLTLRGLGCGDCGGRCSRPLGMRGLRGLRGLGADPNSDTFVDPNTGCVMDTDGNLLTCPTGSGGTQQPTHTNTPVAPWWDGKTNIGGAIVSNPVLAAGAVGFAFLLAGMGGKRR